MQRIKNFTAGNPKENEENCVIIKTPEKLKTIKEPVSILIINQCLNIFNK